MSRFLYKTILFALPLLLLMVSVNYTVDPARLFDEDYEKYMADVITSGKYVTNISNYDDRIFQKEFILRQTQAPDLLVLGSSRSMQINSTFFKGAHVLNSSVAGATIEDIIALYQIYNLQNKLPKKIILGIDPWTFNEKCEIERWKSLENFYYDFVKKPANVSFLKYEQLISPSYFQYAIKTFFWRDKETPQATLQKFNETNTVLNDGSLVYRRSKREATFSEVESMVAKYISEEIYGIENFTEISESILRDFKLLVSDILSRDIEVVFFLAPYHPQVYKVATQKYPMVLKSEELIKKYASTHNIKVYGSFDPHALELNERDFYDGMHCKEDALKKVLLLND